MDQQATASLEVRSPLPADTIAAQLAHALVADLASIMTEELLTSGSLKEIALVPPLDLPYSCEEQALAPEPRSMSERSNSGARYLRLVTDGHAQYLGIPVWTIVYMMPLLSRDLLQARCSMRAWPSSDPVDDKLRSTVLQATRLMLSVCADHGMALNMRKEVLISSTALPMAWIHTELAASCAFLTRKPSSSAQWHHRFWLIEQELTQQPRPSSNSLLEREHTVVALAATRKPRNYYAWTYRVQLRQLVRNSIGGADQDVWDDALDVRLVREWMASSGNSADKTAQHYLRMIGTTEVVASRVEMASQLSDGKEWNVIRDRQ